MFRHLWRHHPIAVALFIGAALATIVFAVRVVMFTLYWANPDHRQVTPEPWMTPGYIAHSWDLKPGAISEYFGAPPQHGKPRTLKDIAGDKDIPVQDVVDQLILFLNSQSANAAPRAPTPPGSPPSAQLSAKPQAQVPAQVPAQQSAPPSKQSPGLPLGPSAPNPADAPGD